MQVLAWIFSAYAMHLAGSEPSVQQRVENVALAVSEVVDEEESFFPGLFGKISTGFLLIKIARHESAFDARAKNAAGDCGVAQVASSTALKLGSSCERMQSDVREGFRVSLLVLKEARHSCGSELIRILSAYASGRCDSARNVAIELLPTW